jgi:hypothetical protein
MDSLPPQYLYIFFMISFLIMNNLLMKFIVSDIILDQLIYRLAQRLEFGFRYNLVHVGNTESIYLSRM